MRDYNIESDLKQEKFEVIKLVQGDKGNKLTINVLEDGKPVSLTGCSITAKYKRADGQVINGSVTNISNNSFDAVIDSDITKVVGTLKMLFSIEKDDVKVSAFMLLADVREGIGENTGSSGGSTGGGEVTVDLSNYYKKSETYSKSQIDSQFKDIANNFKLVAGANNAIKLMFGTKELSSITINGGTVDPMPTPNTYTVTNNLSNASTSNSATSVKGGTSYSATITAYSNYRIKNVTVLMGGVDITNSAYSGGRISISAVTGNISITVTTEYVSGEIVTYTITNNLSHAKNSNIATTIQEKTSYNATITADSNYRIKNVTVTMYGTDITNDVYSNGTIIIPRVIGDIVITVTTEYVSGGGDESNLDGLLKDRY